MLQALRKRSRRFHLLWFDEPCSLSNVAAVRKITDENVTASRFRRHIHGGGDFQNLLREGAIDVLRPDIARNGISQIRRMADDCRDHYVAVAPYHDGGPIATARRPAPCGKSAEFLHSADPLRLQRTRTGRCEPN